jgi:hypothetical protein
MALANISAYQERVLLLKDDIKNGKAHATNYSLKIDGCLAKRDK